MQRRTTAAAVSAGTGAPRSLLEPASWLQGVLWLVVVHAVATAILRLVPAFEALTVVPAAAIDLHIRYDEVQRWFAGERIYGDAHSANYPPGTYALLWPLMGWLPEPPARLLFAASTAAALLVAGLVAMRTEGLPGAAGRALLLVFLLPLGATQITVWIGQLGLHVTAALMLAGLLLFGIPRARGGEHDASAPAGGPGPATDAAAAALLALSLVKPTLSVPVVAAALILTRRWRPALLTAGFYTAATLAAAAAQRTSPVTLTLEWLGREEIMNLPLGSVNAYLWLHWLGVETSMLPVSLLLLLLLAGWTWRHRTAPPWLVLGVAALTARLWIHHRAFDDVLLLLPAVALAAVATAAAPAAGRTAVTAAALAAGVYVLGHAPYSFLSGEQRTFWLITEAGRTVLWLGALVFLVRVTPRTVRAV